MTGAKDNRARSARAFAQACKYLPGGVDSPVRAFGGVETGPVFVASAKGSKIHDIDGNEYIDYVCSWGPMILGHSHPAVLEAIIQAAKKGSSFGAPTLAETELAKKVIAAYPSIEKVRFVSSGTEAVMTAIRLARAYTGKDLIIKMVGCYHGHSDSLLVSAGSGLAETALPRCGNGRLRKAQRQDRGDPRRAGGCKYGCRPAGRWLPSHPAGALRRPGDAGRRC